MLRFVGDGDQKKFTKNPRRFSMQNSQANTKKIFTKFFWRAGKVKNGYQNRWVSKSQVPGTVKTRDLGVGESLRGKRRGNRTKSLCEGHLPLRGFLRGRVLRGFEVFRGF